MYISVVVCTKDRKNSLEKFLNSLLMQTRLPEELIIVDSSDHDDTKKMLQQINEKLPFDLIYEKTSPSSARQRNIGAELSNGSHLFFFDDDVVLDFKYIHYVEETFKNQRSNRLGGVTGRIVNLTLKLELLDKFFKKAFFLSDLGNGTFKLSGFPSYKVGDKPGFVMILSGCNMIYPKKVFSQFKFDESLTEYSYMEDVDLSYRVSKKYNFYYQPKAKLAHFPTSYKTYNSKYFRKVMVQNHRYIFKKNYRKDMIHLCAHWISLIGIFLYNFLVERDLKACSGIIDGLKEPKKC
jgi:glycosyltransferase involved in cell wall biosynthesis